MAGNGSDRNSSLAGSLTKKGEEELGILAFSLEQCPLDCLGTERWSLRPDCFADLSCFAQHQGNREEYVALTIHSCQMISDS